MGRAEATGEKQRGFAEFRYAAGTELARAQCSTIRLKLFKIGATIARGRSRTCTSKSAPVPGAPQENPAPPSGAGLKRA